MTREESYRCVQRRDSMICIAFFCIIVLGVVLTMPFVAQGQTSHVEQSDQFVCVQAGDHNGLSSSLIVPGQIIEVPAF